jgi:hypothetical protein
MEATYFSETSVALNRLHDDVSKEIGLFKTTAIRTQIPG